MAAVNCSRTSSARRTASARAAPWAPHRCPGTLPWRSRGFSKFSKLKLGNRASKSRMKTGGASWYRVANIAEVDSPALLVYPERVEENLRRMVAIAGGVERLRPHIKTHKLPEILRLHQALGITKFKCATRSEEHTSELQSLAYLVCRLL